MQMKMMRMKQVVMLSFFGLLSTVLFLSLRKITPENYKVSREGKEKINDIIANSKHFTGNARKSVMLPEETSGNGSQAPGHNGVVVNDENNLLYIANRISKHNRTVLVTMVNDAYLLFTYSWLCNTKNMNIHKSVLIITTDPVSKEKLMRDWPEVSVVSMDMDISKGDQTYSEVGYVKIMIERTKMLLSLLMANIEIFLFEVDCLWFTNPIPEFQNITGYDILVNPVANTDDVYAGGFLWLYRTDRAKSLWTKLTEEMVALGERIRQKSDKMVVSEAENDQQFFSRLINNR